MKNYLSANIWQIFSTIFALYGLISSQTDLRFPFTKSVKEIQFIIDNFMPLIDNARESLSMASDIEVFYKRRSVKNVYIIKGRIQNTGKSPITKGDYNGKLSFDFSPYKILDVDTAEEYKLFPVRNPDSKFSIVPELLNPGDVINIDFIIAGEDGKFSKKILPSKVIYKE